MKMTQEELKAKIEAHALWLKTRFDDEVKGACADLTHADLTDADLTRTNLTCANLSHADLTCANLSHADLTDADLTHADLSHANLTDANLTDANLTDADLTHADLTCADLDVWKASPFVYDALAAVFSAQMALKKTRIEWMDRYQTRMDENDGRNDTRRN